MTAELTTSLIERINVAHHLCMAADQHVRDVIMTKLNRARECGILLSTLREATEHGKWQTLFDDVSKGQTGLAFRFHHETARLYMRFAQAHPDEWTAAEINSHTFGSLKAAMIATGAIPSPEGNRGGGQLTGGDWLTAFTREMMAATATIVKAAETVPVENWPEDRRDLVKRELKPLVDLYARL